MWKYRFKVPEKKKVRMIVYTDCKNEADDQFALAHHLLTPKFIVKGIIGAHFNIKPQQWREGNTAKASYDEIKKVLSIMGLEGQYPVFCGAERPLADEHTYQESEAARFIVEEAMRDDPSPLYIACQGSITDLASAILMKPEICRRMTAVWVGGGMYPEGGWEFNMGNDIAAVNVLFSSEMPVWQIPLNVCKQTSVSLAELQHRVAPCGEIGNYLFEQMIAYNDAHGDEVEWPGGEMWGLGDQGTIGVFFVEHDKTDDYTYIEAPRIGEDMKYVFGQNNREIRVYHTINARLIMEDFYAKLAINFGGK